MADARDTQKAITTYKNKRNKNEDLEPLIASGRALATELREPHCRECKLNALSSVICMFGHGPVPAKGMIVTSYPNQWDAKDGRYITSNSHSGSYFDAVLSDADMDRNDFYITSAIKCQPGSQSKDSDVKIAQKICGPKYLDDEIARVKPNAILALGSAAYYHFTHAAGLTKHRGQAFYDTNREVWIIPTVTPDYVMLFPNYHSLFLSDVRKFNRFVRGVIQEPAVDIRQVLTREDFDEMMYDLTSIDESKTLTFDLETRGFIDYLDVFSKVWCGAVTKGIRNSDEAIITYLVPLEHPDSPFVHSAVDLIYVMRNFCDLILQSKVNGHNVKFDVRALDYVSDKYNRINSEDLDLELNDIRTLALWPNRKELKTTTKTRASIKKVSGIDN